MHACILVPFEHTFVPYTILQPVLNKVAVNQIDVILLKANNPDRGATAALSPTRVPLSLTSKG